MSAGKPDAGSGAPDPGSRIGALLFRYRGWVPVPALVYAVAAAHSRPAGVAAGLPILVAGEGVRLWAAAHLGLTARASSPRAVKLVTGGPYARTRHPMYWGNLALVVGYALVSGAGWPWFPSACALLTVLLYRGHAGREERALAAAFPEEAARYRAAVPLWRWRRRPVPVPVAGEVGRPGWRRALRVEALTLNAIVWLLAALGLRAWAAGHGG